MDLFQEQHREEFRKIADFLMKFKSESLGSLLQLNLSLGGQNSLISQIEKKIIDLVEISLSLLDKSDQYLDVIKDLYLQLEEKESSHQISLEYQRQVAQQWQNLHAEELEKNNELMDQRQFLEDKIDQMKFRIHQQELLIKQMEESSQRKQPEKQQKYIQNLLEERELNNQKIQQLSTAICSYRSQIRQQELQIQLLEQQVVSLEKDLLARNELILEQRLPKNLGSQDRILDIIKKSTEYNGNQNFKNSISIDDYDEEETTSRCQETMEDVCGGDHHGLFKPDKNYKGYAHQFNLKLDDLKLDTTTARINYDQQLKLPITERSTEDILTGRAPTYKNKKKAFDFNFISTPRKAQNPYIDFFQLISQSAKLNSPDFCRVIMIDTNDLYHDLIKKTIPFNLWYDEVRLFLEAKAKKSK